MLLVFLLLCFRDVFCFFVFCESNIPRMRSARSTCFWQIMRNYRVPHTYTHRHTHEKYGLLIMIAFNFSVINRLEDVHYAHTHSWNEMVYIQYTDKIITAIKVKFLFSLCLKRMLSMPATAKTKKHRPKCRSELQQKNMFGMWLLRVVFFPMFFFQKKTLLLFIVAII